MPFIIILDSPSIILVAFAKLKFVRNVISELKDRTRCFVSELAAQSLRLSTAITVRLVSLS